MSAEDRLLRAYERLLWAYPRWYRRERGAELLTTLLDAADPGQRRPSALDVRDLVVGGFRTRLRPPRTWLARIVASQVALYLAVVGAALGFVASGYPGPPGEDEAVAAAMIAVPERPRNLPGPVVRCDLICPDPAAGDDVTSYRRPWDHTDDVRIDYHVPRERASTVVADGRRRLAAAGWRVTELHTQDDGIVSFEASDGRLDLVVTGGASEERPVGIGVSKAFSARMAAFLAVGSVAGLLAGWSVAAWASQRLRVHRERRRGSRPAESRYLSVS